MKKRLSSLGAAFMLAVSSTQAAVIPAPPEAAPLLSVAEINSGLKVQPAYNGGWSIYKDHFYYACNNRLNLQVVLPVFYTFDFKTADDEQTRMAISAETEKVIQSVLDWVADDTFLVGKFRSHSVLMSRSVDTSDVSGSVRAYFERYQNSSAAQAHSLSFVQYDGALILARGCGTITDRESYKKARESEKYLIQYDYL
jgi:hypothetical protein